MFRVQNSATKKFLTTTIFTACLLSISPVQASEPEIITQPKAASMLNVTLNQITLVKLDEQIADALVGNPAIADITIQSNKSFIITGKSYGHTNIIMLNKKGEAIFNKSIAVDDDRENVVRVLHGASRLSYTCSPNCQPTPTLGDDPKHVKSASENITGKLKEINGTLVASEN